MIKGKILKASLSDSCFDGLNEIYRELSSARDSMYAVQSVFDRIGSELWDKDKRFYSDVNALVSAVKDNADDIDGMLYPISDYLMNH